MNKKSYSRYRKSRRWRTKRRTIMKRAGYNTGKSLSRARRNTQAKTLAPTRQVSF